jgi:hypothetical protein
MADRPEIEEARQCAVEILEDDTDKPVDDRTARLLARAFLDLLGKQSEREKALEELWQGIENLRGYQHCLADGCDPMESRGRHFGAHIDALLDHLRAALAPLPEQSEGHKVVTQYPPNYPDGAEQSEEDNAKG